MTSDFIGPIDLPPEGPHSIKNWFLTYKSLYLSTKQIPQLPENAPRAQLKGWKHFRHWVKHYNLRYKKSSMRGVYKPLLRPDAEHGLHEGAAAMAEIKP